LTTAALYFVTVLRPTPLVDDEDKDDAQEEVLFSF
jgi:hypothetical protein